jgi:hypothetical protein
MSEQQNSPKLAAWNVKDFPVELRQQITDRAAREQVTVAAWLVAYFTTHGIDGQEIQGNLSLVKRASGAPEPAINHDEISDVCRLVDAACKLAEHRESMPRRLFGAMQRAVMEQLGAGHRYKVLANLQIGAGP